MRNISPLKSNVSVQNPSPIETYVSNDNFVSCQHLPSLTYDADTYHPPLTTIPEEFLQGRSKRVLLRGILIWTEAPSTLNVKQLFKGLILCNVQVIPITIFKMQGVKSPDIPNYSNFVGWCRMNVWQGQETLISNCPFSHTRPSMHLTLPSVTALSEACPQSLRKCVLALTSKERKETGSTQAQEEKGSAELWHGILNISDEVNEVNLSDIFVGNIHCTKCDKLDHVCTCPNAQFAGGVTPYVNCRRTRLGNQ